MKKLLSALLLIGTIYSCDKHKDDDTLKTSDKQLIQIGNRLAKWGNTNCKTISIEEKHILWQGPNSGGCSKVYFQFETIDRETYFDLESLEKSMKNDGIQDWIIDREINIRKTFRDNEDEVLQNLKFAFNSSSCQLAELVSNINSIESNSESELIKQHLKCLGEVKISEGASGNE